MNMSNRVASLSVMVVGALMLTAAEAAAASGADPSIAASPASPSPGPWLVRAEGGLMAMRDSWLGIPAPEVGLTVGRDLASGFSVELTGNAREPDSAERRAWSAAAAVRWIAAANANGRHALTIAGGPFLEVGNVVHGTLPFARGELAYVYRSPIGLTVLAGGGVNMALASSSYVAPPPKTCPDSGGDAITFCIDLGPDADELHAGDMVGHMRLAVGWQF
jgi:hypothetical protein